MRALALAAFALVAASGTVRAAAFDETLYQRAELAVVEPWSPLPGPGQADIRVPHAGIDPGMAIRPPRVGARMPVVTPPGTLDQPD